MDSLITAAGRALAAGDPIGALKRVALREDAAALALRGIAMAQLGDFERARGLLRTAAKAFHPREDVARARCAIAEAEIALILRDLSGSADAIATARATLATHGDRINAAHAANLEARYRLLVGELDRAERLLDAPDPGELPAALLAARELIAAGIAMRRLRMATARGALMRADAMARRASIPALAAEVAATAAAMDAPAARRVACGIEAMVGLDQVEALLGSGALVVDACRGAIRRGGVAIPLGTRPVLFALARVLAEAWPGDVSRETLLARTFGARHADDSHRARLRVEIGRLRRALRGVAGIRATAGGFVLVPDDADVVLLLPPVEDAHGPLLALLADGEAWSSSALALALGTSPRTVQRALDALAGEDKVQPVGAGRSRRWTIRAATGFPTSLLLPGPLPGG